MTIVFNLYEFKLLGFLPEAYIVNYKSEETLAYIQQRATEETVHAYSFKFTEHYRNLLGIIELLKIEELEQKYNSKKGRKKSLIELCEDKIIKKTVVQYVDRQMDTFLQIIVAHEFQLTFGVGRKSYVQNFLLDTRKRILQPHLYFQRNRTEMRYRLSMLGEKKKIAIHQEVYVLVNEPAWIVWKDSLVQIAHINGNMLKPFRDKEEVIVPLKHMKTYFQKFVVKVASKVQLETDGFEVKQYNSIQQSNLKLSENFLNQTLGIKVRFQYEGASFAYKDQQNKHTRLEFESTDDIVIHQAVRDLAKENEMIQKLLDLGLQSDITGVFQLSQTKPNQYQLLHWFIREKEILENAGFHISPSTFQQKNISLDAFQLEIGTTLKNDWFDVHGSVQIGNFSIPFPYFFSYIKQEDHFYPLEDGTFFILPEEWMERYKRLATDGKVKGKKATYPKSLYTLVDALEEVETKGNMLEISELEEVDYEVSKYLKAELRPYQLEGVKWLVRHYHNGLGACLADDMGLGKTLQTIATLLYAKENQPKESTPQIAGQLGLFENVISKNYYAALKSLIVLPASLVFNWEKEIKKFAPHLQVFKYVGTKRKKHEKLLGNFDAILTTYQTALRDVKILQKYDFSFLILDESQHIKNKSSKVFKAIHSLSARHKISLSGTPIENSLSDLWSQMEFINPKLLGSYNFFRKHYIHPIEKLDDEDQKSDLREKIQPFLLRRTKGEVAKDLPPLSTQIFYTEMLPAQQKLYEKEKSAARNYLLQSFKSNDFGYRSQVLQSLTKLRQLANHPALCEDDYDKGSGKFSEVLEQLEGIRKSNHKALIFSSFTKYLALFRQYFDANNIPYSLLQGDQTQKARAQAVQAFQEQKNIQIFLISLKAGGTGLNLTAADYVFILDPWWNPQAEQQAIARAHRIGQDKSVFATKFISTNSIEEKILQLQNKKSRLADDMINSSGQISYSKRDVEFLFG